jgi:hypothetical protein
MLHLIVKEMVLKLFNGIIMEDLINYLFQNHVEMGCINLKPIINKLSISLSKNKKHKMLLIFKYPTNKILPCIGELRE